MGNVLSITTSDSISIELNMSLSKSIVRSTESKLKSSTNDLPVISSVYCLSDSLPKTAR